MKQKIVLPAAITILLYILFTVSTYQVSDFAPQENVARESLEVDWWPMFRHDQSHRGFSTSKAPDSNSTLWVYDTKHGIFSSPAVSEGVVFIGSPDSNLYALNATTGFLIWKYDTDGPIDSSPAVANGKVFVGSYDGNVYALNKTNGKRIWNFTTSFENWPQQVQSSPVVANGKVFIGSGRGKVYALDENTGAEIWSFTAEVVLFSSPAVAKDIVYFGSRDRKIYALNASTGGLIWSYTTGDEIYSSPCVADGKVFIGSNDGNLYALNASTGALIWSFATFPHGVSGVVRSSPAFSNGKVFVGTYPGFLADWRYGAIFALNASTGVPIWNYTTGPISYSSPAVADDKVFVMNFYNGTVYALNATTGAYVWSYDTGGSYSSSSPAVADGRIFIGSGNGKVYCFGPMLYFNIEVDPTFYDNRGEPLTPSSWTINFPNGTRKAASSPETYYGPMGTYSIGSVIWNGYQVFSGEPVSIFLDSNITWRPRIDCILPTSISISLSSSTSYVGFKVEINGNLTCNEIGVSAAPIRLSYSVTGGESWNDITLVNTASDGSYFAIWMPSATGNYLLRAIWSGNSTYPGTTIMVSLAVIPFEEQNVFSVISNSTVSNLAFNSTSRELSFTVTGPSGTTGYVNVYIAKTLVENIADVKVYLNGEQLDYTATSLDDSWLLHFTYLHSKHKVTISLRGISPPFIKTPLGKVVLYGIPITTIVILIVLYFIKKKQRSP